MNPASQNETSAGLRAPHAGSPASRADGAHVPPPVEPHAQVAPPLEKPSEPAPAARSSPGTRRRRLGALFAGAAVIAGALVGLLVGREDPAPAAHAAAEVPHVEGDTIVLPAGFRERAGIEIQEVTRASLTPVLRVVGTVSLDPAHVAAAGTRLRGMVRKLHKLEGDTVKAGDLLAEIESADLGEAQASVSALRAHRLAAERNAKRERELSEQKLTTARELEMAEAELKEQRALLTAAEQRVTAFGGGHGGPFGVYMLRAPIDGTVVERHVSAGQSVEDHLVAFRVADLDHLWVELSVFERRLHEVKRDDRVVIRPLADPEVEIGGRVAYVGDQIDLDTRSAVVRIQIDDHERRLRPGQSVTAEIQGSAPATPRITVPHEAITFVDGRATAFVAVADDKIVPRPIELGATDGVRQAVVGGLKDGDKVVVKGVFALKSELFR